MLREMFVIAAFLLILCGIVGEVVTVERSASRQSGIAEKIIEDANETD